MSIRDFPESFSQRILVGIILAGRLSVLCALRANRSAASVHRLDPGVSNESSANIADDYFNEEINSQESLQHIADLYLSVERQESLQHIADPYFSKLLGSRIHPCRNAIL